MIEVEDVKGAEAARDADTQEAVVTPTAPDKSTEKEKAKDSGKGKEKDSKAGPIVAPVSPGRVQSTVERKKERKV